MSTYNYFVVNTSDPEWKDFGNELPSQEGLRAKLERRMNQLGAQGWKFCGCVAPFLFFIKETLDGPENSSS